MAQERVFDELYEITSTVLGQGSNATVYLGICKETNEEVAIKKIEKKAGCFEADLHHVAILHTVDHENIIQLKDFFDSPSHLHLVLELARGRDIVARITTKGSFSEDNAVRYTRQILGALAHCHKRGVVHCDLKPENILFDSEDDGSIVKVGDFGFAQVLVGDAKLVERLGTPHYVAPEVVTGKGYDTAADMWSLGVITYIILSGHFPFVGGADLTHHDYQRNLFRAITQGEYTFPKQYFAGVSDLARDFIRNLLEKDPKRRMSAVQALEHPWITSASSQEPLTQTQESLKQLSAKVNNVNKDRVSHSLSSVFIHTDRSAPDRAVPLTVSPSINSDDSTLGRRLASLVSLAYDSSDANSFNAAQAICNACVDPKCRVSLVRAGCLRALTHLSKTGDVAICNQVGLALVHIVATPVCAAQVVADDELFGAIISLGSKPSGVVARQAARVVCALVRNESYREKIVNANGISVILRLLTSILTEHQREALQALCSLTENVEFHAKILASDVLGGIARCVPETESVGCLFLCGVLLQLLARGGVEGAASAIVSQCLPAVSVLLRHPAKPIKGHALAVLVSLHAFARDELVAAGDETVMEVVRQLSPTEESTTTTTTSEETTVAPTSTSTSTPHVNNDETKNGGGGGGEEEEERNGADDSHPHKRARVEQHNGEDKDAAAAS